MTVSANDRTRNMDEALMAFLSAMGDLQFVAYDIDPARHPDVLATTWTELEKRGWLEDINANIPYFRFTPFGYARALKVTGRTDAPEFRERLGQLCGVLKDAVNRR